jgi:hypothetical protein
MATAQVHVVSKGDITQHATISVAADALAPLAADSVRVRCKLITITRNNVSYARLGGWLHWWDTYPVSPPGITTSLPAPYDDAERWGIVPAWGYGEVLASNKDGIAGGALIWGFWPTSSLPVDLKLSGPKPDGHYWEVSEHRAKLMQLYNHYELVQSPLSEDIMGWRVGMWLAIGPGFAMNRYCFPPITGTGDKLEASLPIVHPSGDGSKWTAADADLRSTVIVNLTASSKTAIGLAWNLRHREAGVGPLGFVEACSAPNSLPSATPGDSPPPFDTKRVTYDGLSSTFDWIASLKPTRIIAADYGAPAGVAQRFHDELLASPAAASIASYVYLLVGADPNGVKLQDPRSSVVQFNMSPLKYAGIEREGLETFQMEQNRAFELWLQEKGMGSTTLDWRSGIAGENGVHGAWDSLFTDHFPRNTSLLYRVE